MGGGLGVGVGSRGGLIGKNLVGGREEKMAAADIHAHITST